MSTGEVATLCGATTASVNNWIKAHKLKAYNTPGGQYRILVKDLLDFIRNNNMPVPGPLAHYLGRKVLIIDDDPETVDMLSELVLQVKPEAAISVAMDGYDGLMKAGDIKPDLIFLDIQLPRIDGFEVCDKIKSNDGLRHTKVFIISAFFGNREFEIKKASSKADEFLTKPVEVPKLMDMVRTVL